MEDDQGVLILINQKRRIPYDREEDQLIHEKKE